MKCYCRHALQYGHRVVPEASSKERLRRSFIFFHPGPRSRNKKRDMLSTHFSRTRRMETPERPSASETPTKPSASDLVPRTRRRETPERPAASERDLPNRRRDRRQPKWDVSHGSSTKLPTSGTQEHREPLEEASESEWNAREGVLGEARTTSEPKKSLAEVREDTPATPRGRRKHASSTGRAGRGGPRGETEAENGQNPAVYTCPGGMCRSTGRATGSGTETSV